MRLISCVALLMVIPAVALLKRGEDLTTDKSKVVNLHQTVKNNRPGLNSGYLSGNQLNIKYHDQKSTSFKDAYSNQFGNGSYFSINPSFTKQ